MHKKAHKSNSESTSEDDDDIRLIFAYIHPWCAVDGDSIIFLFMKAWNTTNIRHERQRIQGTNV